MVIDSMFVYHFVDPDLRVETFFKKDEAAENGGIDFKRGYRHLCTLILKVEENFMQSLSALLLFFGDKKVSFKSSLDLYFHPSIIEFRIEEKIHTKAVVNVSRGAKRRVFLSSWETLGGG